ncbi:18952_t:CDS:2 [Funneliformis geosporum]|uniref:18952_t:CDS:1 n=1 Tax=Funneliformis geosporum TaxID=1117311 RepID=A0A9W4SVE7_9GLOM|nr:18952_t:CDS:2 [Funneliformis geosporum]
MSFKNFQQMNQFINKYKSDVEKIKNEKTNSEELISIMNEVYQENTEVELVKSEIPKELIRKRKTQKKNAESNFAGVINTSYFHNKLLNQIQNIIRAFENDKIKA